MNPVSSISHQPLAASSTDTNVHEEVETSCLKDLFSFSMQWLRSPRAVGTPFPCSPYVAAEILRSVPHHQSYFFPRRILEIGPGMGAFTQGLVERLGPDDVLDLVELEKPFCDALQHRYAKHPNVHVHHCSITDWNPELKYDHVITAVPLNALPTAALVKPILESYKNLVSENGTLSAIEYVGTSTLKRLFLCRGKEMFDEVQELKVAFFSKYAVDTVIVGRNVPPARVFHCSIPKES